MRIPSPRISRDWAVRAKNDTLRAVGSVPDYRRTAVLLSLLLSGLGGGSSCDGALLTLGSSQGGAFSSVGGASGGTPATEQAGASSMGGGGASSGAAPNWRFTEVQSVAALSSTSKDDNPTLAADMLLLCFTSDRAGGAGDVDVWCSERPSLNEPFAAPVAIAAVNSADFESSAALNLDGLSLWFASTRSGGNGGLDVWLSTRASRSAEWAAPVWVESLSTTADEIPRSLALGDTVMPLSRRLDGTYRIFFADRVLGTDTFEPAQLLAELGGIDVPVADAHLSEDGLSMLFTQSEAGSGDIYVVERASLSDAFGVPVQIEGVNTEFDDRDPWLSGDGRVLYFSSNRSGVFEIYQAQRASD